MVASALLAALTLTLCPPGPRDNCVVDGDTFWLAGEKIRIAEIDAPEIERAKCAAEREAGERAKRRLHHLINSGRIFVERTGKDRYGRTLAHVSLNGGNVGAVLVSEGLARTYAGDRREWC